jgi:putative hydrolase of the HAD superfamily
VPGALISCRLKLCKPEPAIYEYALGAYGLRAQDTVFIDDVEANVAAAAKLGIRTILFRDAAQCERELRALGLA